MAFDARRLPNEIQLLRVFPLAKRLPPKGGGLFAFKGAGQGRKSTFWEESRFTLYAFWGNGDKTPFFLLLLPTELLPASPREDGTRTHDQDLK